MVILPESRESYLKNITQMFLDDGFFLKLPDSCWTPFPSKEGCLSIRGKLGLMLPGVECYAEMIELKPETTFPEHTHTHDHTIHILDGPCLVGKWGLERTYKSGDTVYIPPEVPHHLRSTDKVVTVLVVGHPKRFNLLRRIWKVILRCLNLGTK